MRRFRTRGSSSHHSSPVVLICLLLLPGYTCCQVFFAIQLPDTFCLDSMVFLKQETSDKKEAIYACRPASLAAHASGGTSFSPSSRCRTRTPAHLPGRSRLVRARRGRTSSTNYSRSRLARLEAPFNIPQSQRGSHRAHS